LGKRKKKRGEESLSLGFLEKRLSTIKREQVSKGRNVAKKVEERGGEAGKKGRAKFEKKKARGGHSAEKSENGPDLRRKKIASVRQEEPMGRLDKRGGKFMSLTKEKKGSGTGRKGPHYDGRGKETYPFFGGKCRLGKKSRHVDGAWHLFNERGPSVEGEVRSGGHGKKTCCPVRKEKGGDKAAMGKKVDKRKEELPN